MAYFDLPLNPSHVFSEQKALEQWFSDAHAFDAKVVIFLGRSNVGKSSLLNALFGQSLAKVSQTPGKTREIRLYQPRDEKKKFYMVDLPGYGHAAVSKAQHQHWKNLLEAFIEGYAHHALYLCLQDSRHPLQANDQQMLDYLTHLNAKKMIVLTKLDSIKNQKEMAGNIKILKTELPQWEMSVEDDCIFTSTHQQQGLEMLVDRMKVFLANSSQE